MQRDNKRLLAFEHPSTVRDRLPEIEISSLPERVTDILLSALLEGRWKPGDQIVESQVAKELRVAQSVVREALRTLEFQGLVTKIANKGTSVTKLSQKQVDQVFRLRREMESLAVRWARSLGRPTTEDAARLGKIIDLMEKTGQERDFQGFCRADLSFHRGIWDLCSDPFLVKALDAFIVPQFAFMLLKSYPSMDLVAVARQHRDWLDALLSASPADAEALTRRMIRSFGKTVTNCLEAQPPDPDEPTSVGDK